MTSPFDFSNSDLFTPATHPQSGVTVHVLTRRVAPLQQGFHAVALANDQRQENPAQSPLDMQQRRSGCAAIVAVGTA